MHKFCGFLLVSMVLGSQAWGQEVNTYDGPPGFYRPDFVRNPPDVEPWGPFKWLSDQGVEVAAGLPGSRFYRPGQTGLTASDQNQGLDFVSRDGRDRDGPGDSGGPGGNGGDDGDSGGPGGNGGDDGDSGPDGNGDTDNGGDGNGDNGDDRGRGGHGKGKGDKSSRGKHH